MTRFASVLIIALLALLAQACGETPQQSARHTVSAAAIALDLTDIASAQAYTIAAHRALEASADMPSYRAAMAPYDTLETALRTARSALDLADSVVRVWEQGGVQPSNWQQAVACLIGALEGVREVVVAAGVPLPAELTGALDAARGFAHPDHCFTDDAGVVVTGGAS